MSLGTVRSIHRYPVKSMAGETLGESVIGSHGLMNDRGWAIVDDTTGLIASAKNPKAWPRLLDIRARLEKDGVVIQLPDGTEVRGEQIAERLSAHFGRRVHLATSRGGKSEMETPSGQLATFELPSGTFFDAASVHLVTTASLARLSDLRRGGIFDVRRFRPNLVIETPDATGFVENAWVGKTLTIGDVRLRVTIPCERCIMTTLAQADLPTDREILTDVVRHNSACMGVYAEVIAGGTVTRGAGVREGGVPQEK